MRAWLFDIISTNADIMAKLNYTAPEARERVMPRRSQSNINIVKPFIVYGLGNATNEDLAEAQDHTAYRQFLQIWIHDEGGSYIQIDEIIEILKKILIGQHSATSNVTTIRWLETSQEFSNETDNTIFRYVRFQAIISKGAPVA